MSGITNYREIAYEAQNLSRIGAFFEVEEVDQDVQIKKLIDDLQEYLVKDHEKLVENIIFGKQDKSKLEDVIDKWLSEQKTEGFLKEPLAKKIVDSIIGWGKLQELVDDPSVTDIFTNEQLEVIKKVRGKHVLTNISFESNTELETFIKGIMIRTGRKINHNHCIEDGMDDIHHIRVSAGISGSPIRKEVVRAPYLALRGYRVQDYSTEFFVKNETFNNEIDSFFKQYVLDSNCFIVGEPSAGKSTLLEYLEKELIKRDPLRRIIRIEEEPELAFESRNSVSFMERKSAGGDDDVRKQYSMADFGKAATRLAADDFIIGEVRGEEAWQLLRLLNLGLRAKYTIHGDSVAEGIHQTVFLMGLAETNAKPEHLMKRVCDSIDFGIFVSHRKVVTVAEVIGYNPVLNEPVINPIFDLELDDDGNMRWAKGELSESFKKRFALKAALKAREV